MNTNSRGRSGLAFRSTRSGMLLLFLSGCAALAGCRQDMADQPSYRPLQPAAFFKDQRSSRPLVHGTVARGQLDDDVHLFTGRKPGFHDHANVAGMAVIQDAFGSMFRQLGSDPYVDTFPFPVTKRVLERGRERYDIFCAVCHDRTGGGNGVIVQRGFTRAPSFHEERLRKAREGYYFQVITKGFGAMPDYSAQIKVTDRWAIIAYIRVLQYSQDAALEGKGKAEPVKAAGEGS